MTIEELQAQVEELKTSNEAMANKNKELLAEVKKERQKAKEVDLDAFHAAIDKADTLESELSKRDGTIKTLQKDFEKVMGDLTKKDAFLNKTILTDGLGKALLEAGVDAKFLPAAQAMLKEQAKVVQNGDDYSAMIGDVSANDFVKSWIETDGKIFTMVQPDTGAGARGGSGAGGDKTASRTQFDSMSPVDKSSFVKSGGTITQ